MHAFASEQADEDVAAKARGADRDDVVADQHRADEALVLPSSRLMIACAQSPVLSRASIRAREAGREGGLAPAKKAESTSDRMTIAAAVAKIDLERSSIEA